MPRSRESHLRWAKNRALKILNEKGPESALEDFEKSLKFHEETKNHTNWGLGMQLQMMEKLNTKTEVKNFINSFS